QVVLHDDGDLCPQRIERHPAQVVLIDANLSRGWVHEPRNKINERMLFQFVGGDYADALAGLDRQADVLEQYPAAARLAQRDVVELQLALQRRQELGTNDLAHLARPIEELEQLDG